MQGTEKQIEWASKIKRQIVEYMTDDSLRRAITISTQNEEDDATRDARVKRLKSLIKAAADTFDQASFWINARFANGAPCLQTMEVINKIRAKAKQLDEEKQ